ncbi:MAG: hypothetical protein ACHP6H_04570, partial [Legionellales bacterium]
MNAKKTLINPKKIPYYLLVAFLTAGASLILGLLSFGGMYAMIPILPLALAAFGLAVAYEGEIYLQNIKSVLKKLFKTNYLQNHMGKEYLRSMCPEDTKDKECPQFFKDYAAQLRLLERFGHKRLNAAGAQRKRRIEKTLARREKWFAMQLFATEATSQSPYALQLRRWLALHEQKQRQEQLGKRQSLFNILKLFSLLAGSFMALGTTYLIVEAFSIIPYFLAIPFAFWPALIVPMALIAGTAYGMLTYNAATDFINNDTINTWYIKLKNDWKEGITVRNVFMTSCAVFLIAITVALTVCTAGTWWTVASKARPLFEWMKRMPPVIMGLFNPLITGLSAICFNFQNTAESLEMLDQATRDKEGVLHKLAAFLSDGFTTLGLSKDLGPLLNPLLFIIKALISPPIALLFIVTELYSKGLDAFSRLRRSENWLQILNPFRIILKITVTPLRLLFFIGHLIS